MLLNLLVLLLDGVPRLWRHLAEASRIISWHLGNQSTTWCSLRNICQRVHQDLRLREQTSLIAIDRLVERRFQATIMQPLRLAVLKLNAVRAHIVVMALTPTIKQAQLVRLVVSCLRWRLATESLL